MLVAITGGDGDLGRAMQRCAPSGYSVRVIDRQAEPKSNTDDYRQVDVLELPALTEAFRNVDAVVHLAALRSPYEAPPATVFMVNAQGSYHVTLACEAMGIQSVVYASSICYYGYLFRSQLAEPPYFPIDEDTPSYAEDSYSLSKRVGEDIMKAFVQRTAGSVVSLRYAYLLAGGATGEPLKHDSARDMSTDASSAKSWWTYIDLDDAAAATWLALQYAVERHGSYEAFNIGADDTHASKPTMELLHQVYPQVELRYPTALGDTSFTALYSNTRARRTLGFRPSTSTWRDRARLKDLA